MAVLQLGSAPCLAHPRAMGIACDEQVGTRLGIPVEPV